MVNAKIVAAAAAGALLASPASAGFYSKSSPVIELTDAKAYDRLIKQSNHTSIVEFYAPWCGHCQNLKPAYEKAAKNLAGLAKVAAVNCDEESNKPFCGQMGVQGFPTLKIVKPGKTAGRPNIEDYKGQRTAKAIVEAVVDKIPNHVQRITDEKLEGFLSESESPKAILFSDKGAVSALLRALAVDYLGSISFAQIRKTQSAAVEKYGISKFPTFILLDEGAEPKVYDGEMKKEGLSKFISQIAEPNPDPAPASSKKAKKVEKKDKKGASASAEFSRSSASHKSADSASAKASATNIDLEDDAVPTDATNAEILEELNNEKPVGMETGPPLLEMLEHAPALQEKCLQHNSASCLLVLLPEKASSEPTAPLDEASQQALASLGEIQSKHSKGKGHLFPFYTVPAYNTAGNDLRAAVGLNKDKTKLEVVLVNGKRSWTKYYGGSDYGRGALEEWVDSIRMGEGTKQKLPADFIPAPADEPVVVEEHVVVEPSEPEPGHDEL